MNFWIPDCFLFNATTNDGEVPTSPQYVATLQIFVSSKDANVDVHCLLSQLVRLLSLWGEMFFPGC